ncbi:MAG: hypothetical protein JMN24_02620 [gamma proteobacterium endosymbiont of Lamellibrachia anaximandri]|nr:hypothetical protein [gamma proteobacterium endosymbiont of Lamellibrachia anaximandri]
MCEELSYTEEQLNRIRKELRYLYGYKKKSKNGYSWQDLINEIMEMVDGLCSGDMQKIPKCCRKKLNFDVNEKRFLKFVKGLPNNLKPGGRHFQKLKSCDHLAVELYLTDPDNGYSGLTTEQLYDRDADSKIPLLLAQYLNKSTNEPSQNSFQKMKGAFSSEIKKGNNDCVSVLTINSSINDHVLIADLHNEESLTQSKNKKASSEKFVGSFRYG